MTGGLLVFGASGMLGQAILAEAKSQGITVAGAARSGADYRCDMTDFGVDRIARRFARATCDRQCRGVDRSCRLRG